MTVIRRKWFIGLILAVGLTAIPVFAYSNSQNETNQDTQKIATVSASKGDTKGTIDKPTAAVPNNTVQKTTPKPIINTNPIIIGNNGDSTKADYSILISDLTSKKTWIENNRNEAWYNNQRSILDSTHQNNITRIRQPYLDQQQNCNTILSIYGSGSAYEACMVQLQQIGNQVSQSISNENNNYNQKVALLLVQYDSYKAWPGIIQNIIDSLKGGTKPDANFYDLYYKIPTS